MGTLKGKRWEALTLGTMLLVLPAVAGCVGGADETGEPLGLQMVTEGNGEVFELDLYVKENHLHNPVGDVEVLAFAFGTSPEGPWTVPGPEIRVTEGTTVRVRLHTETPHTIHWHGISLPWAMDGVPFMTQDVGAGVYTYEFIAWETGTYWYHCHVEAPAHVDAGLFGAFIVEPADPGEDPAFDREETLILSEMDSQLFTAFEVLDSGTVDPDELPKNPQDAAEAAYRMARQTADIGGIIAHSTTGVSTIEEPPRDYYPLYSIRYRPQYDTFMFNGKSFPDTEPIHMESGETLRLRLVNAGQLVHTVHVHGHHFLVTHKDGYKLPVPYYADTIGLFPAERYDIYIEGYNPGIWDVHDHGGGWNVGGYTSNDFAFPGGMNTMLVYDDFEYAELAGPVAERTAGDYRVFAPSYKGVNNPFAS